jgi:hypothetical protein
MAVVAFMYRDYGTAHPIFWLVVGVGVILAGLAIRHWRVVMNAGRPIGSAPTIYVALGELTAASATILFLFFMRLGEH